MEQYNKWYFRIAGLITFLGALPLMLFPIQGTLMVWGIDISSWPSISPLIGHWGVMVFGIGVLLYISSFKTELRKPIIWYALIEKAYMVSMGIFYVITDPSIGEHYSLATTVDSILILGGMVYLLRTKKTSSIQ